ncbi:MAG: hypothetical protein E7645_01930 [Ruminococcaceae bacterium]|nr:hypothetical protein [Oscillospiraceae bacterium]
MRKILKILLTVAVVAALAGHLAGLGFFSELKDKTDQLSKKGLHLWLSLSSRVEALEDSVSAFGEQVERESSTSSLHSDTQEPHTDTPVSEETPTSAVTLPQEPETLPHVSETRPSETAPSVTEAFTSVILIIKSHEGVIGIFDEQDNLLRIVSIAVMTLPAEDRAALEEGLIAASEEEVNRILDRLA